MSVAIGIDLGTTNTVVAAVVDGVAVTLEDDQQRRLLPSVVSFHPSSTVLVGEVARERRLIDPENTIFSVKPILGRPWDSDEVQLAKSRFPFKLVQGAKNSTMVLGRDVAYALPEISAFVLRRAKSIAEAALGQPVDRAVITVPANFNDLQRASTKIAGKLAGLEVMRILNEPTAAALAYGQSISKAEKIAVYDLGGGTFDVTLLDLTGNVFEVLATAGDTALGGDDIDRILAERIAIEVIKRFNVDPRTNPAAGARLSFIAEELKKELSTAYQAQREITGIGYHEGGNPITMPFVMTREELENLTGALVERTIAVAKQSIEIIGLSARDFDRVILVGGSTRMPLVARRVEHLFGQPPHLKVNPDEVVALGAAIQAHALNRSKGAHKRRSAHDQLAQSQQKASGEQVATRPPDADPALAPADVPKAPQVPNFAQGNRAGQPLSAPTVPEFISFNKAPATISFGDEAPKPKPAKPPVPLAKPPVPLAKPPVPLAKPPVPTTSTKPTIRGGVSPGAKPAGTLARPPTPGERPSSPGDRPSSPGDRPSSPGDRPSSPGDRPSAPGQRAPLGARTAPVLRARQPTQPMATAPELPPPARALPVTARELPPTEPPPPGLEPVVAETPPALVEAPSAPRIPAPSSRNMLAASPVQNRGQTDHAAPLMAARPSARPIDGAPARHATGDAPAGPKPARRSVPVPAVPDLGLSPEIPELPVEFQAPSSSEIVAAPELDFDIALPAEVSQAGPVPPNRAAQPSDAPLGGDFFQNLELSGGMPELTSERFQQGSAINTSMSTPLLIDVTPLSLGVETVGGYADVLIPANSPVPCEKTRTFLTASDGQATVSIRVAQGESSRFAANTRLGDLELTGLRSARRGEVKIAVTFELDADGILNVRARDHDTGRETAATMRLAGASTDAEDIGAMQQRQARHNVA